MSYIYIIKNTVNDKVYIGKTCKSIEERFTEHIYFAKTAEYRFKRVLYLAMNKYGIDKFYVEQLESDLTDEQACKREQYYIEQYRSYVGFDDCNGYNMTLGGDGQAWTDYAKVVDVYLENNRNQTKTAEILKCAKKTVHRACKLLNIDIKPNMKKVYLYDKEGNLLEEFPFVKKAIEYCKDNNIKGYDKLNRQNEWIVNNYVFKVIRD